MDKRKVKKLLPSILFEPTTRKKTGIKYNTPINTRLTKAKARELDDLLKEIHVKRSLFVRYAIEKYISEVQGILDDYKTDKAD